MRFLEIHRQLNEATKEYNYVKIISDKIGKFLDYFQKNVDKFSKNKNSDGSYSFPISEIVKDFSVKDWEHLNQLRKGTINFVKWKKATNIDPTIKILVKGNEVNVKGVYYPPVDKIIIPYLDFKEEDMKYGYPWVDKIKSTLLHELTHKLQNISSLLKSSTAQLSREDWLKDENEKEAMLNQIYEIIQSSIKNKFRLLGLSKKEYFKTKDEEFKFEYIDFSNELYRIFKSEEDFEKEFYRDAFRNKNILSRADELNKIDKNIMKDFLSDSYHELRKEFENVYPEKKIEKKDGKYSLTESFENDYKKFIAYHQTSKENAKQIKRSGFNFKNAAQKILWFTNNLKGLKDESLGSANTGAILKLEVTINKAADWDLYDQKNLDELEKLEFDGVILKEKNGDFDGFVFSPKQLKVLDVIDSVENIKESEEEKHLGYKIVNFDGKGAYSIADKKVKYSLKKNDIHTGNIYLGTSKKYATEYYSTDSDDPDDPEELLFTYEFSPKDIKKGNLEDKDYMTGGSEIIVSKAKLINVYNITKKKSLVESEERSHGKLMSELKPSLKTVMIFRARDDKSDTFEAKDYVTVTFDLGELNSLDLSFL